MFYTVYKITNQINGKIYIGAHQSLTIDDRYMGSGRILARAKVHHGKQNFKKEILWFCETRSGMYQLERLLVNNEFVKRKDTYNVQVGGSDRGPITRNEIDQRLEKRKNVVKKLWITDGVKSTFYPINQDIPEGWRAGRVTTETHKENSRKASAERNYIHSPEIRQRIATSLKGRTFSNETREKISKSRVGKASVIQHTEASKAKISAAALNNNPGFKTLHTCPICYKQAQRANIIRHHGLNGEKCPQSKISS